MEDMLRTVKHKAEKEDITQLKEYFNQSYRENLFYKTKPYYGIDKMLDNLKAQGLKLAVFSNKPDEPTQRLILKRCLVDLTQCAAKEEDTPESLTQPGLYILPKSCM